jgi:hypothetical protein
VAAVFAFGLAAGCGKSEGVTVTGTVEKDGKPYAFAPNEEVQVGLVGSDANGRPINMGELVNPTDGTFAFRGPSDKGMAPGTYKVTVSSRTATGPKRKADRFADDFGPINTPLTYTVTTDDPQAIVIDVGKKTVTRK